MQLVALGFAAVLLVLMLGAYLIGRSAQRADLFDEADQVAADRQALRVERSTFELQQHVVGMAGEAIREIRHGHRFPG